MNGQLWRRFMVLAHKHGFTNGDYIFIIINYYKQRKLFGIYDWKQVASYFFNAKIKQTILVANLVILVIIIYTTYYFCIWNFFYH